MPTDPKPKLAMDGYLKVAPLTEGYVVKGGINRTSRITVRPPAPQPMRPAGADAPASPAKPTNRE